MNNNIKREMEKIEIPEELHARAELGIRQVKQEERRWKRRPKWMIGIAAALLIIVASFSNGGSYITDATETLIGKIFGIEEQAQIQEEIQNSVPDQEAGAEEAKAAFQQIEQHLQLAEDHLSPEEFADYSQLIKEDMKLRAKSMSSKGDWDQLDQQLTELNEKILSYGIYDLMTHTLEEAQAMVSYPINYPAYLPSGYELIREEAITDVTHVEEDPFVLMEYQEIDGEMNFILTIEKIDTEKENELEWYDHTTNYQLDGNDFTHGYDDQGIDTGNVQGMRVAIPEQGYEIIMHASALSKEDMEKVLLSMIE